MSEKFKEHLAVQLANIRATGLYKSERVIATPQAPAQSSSLQPPHAARRGDFRPCSQMPFTNTTLGDLAVTAEGVCTLKV